MKVAAENNFYYTLLFCCRQKATGEWFKIIKYYNDERFKTLISICEVLKSEFYNDSINEYLSELLKKEPKFPPLYKLQELMSTINMGWMNHMQTLLDSINNSIMSQLQAIMKPISRISRFFSLIPNFRLSNQEENKDENDLDETN